jgi:hypothetical protein
MRAKFGNFAGGSFANVNGDANDTDKRAGKDQCHEPGGNVSDAQGLVKRDDIVNRRAGMQKYFCQPRHQDQNKNENIIAFQAAPHRFQFADFETGQNQIFANELFPFTLEQIAIFHDHRDQEMRLKHPDARAKCVVKTVTTRLDPEQHPDDCQIKKENDVRHLARGECDGDDRRAAGDCPICGHVQPLPPDHDPAHLAAIKMRHGIDVARVVNAPLQGDCPLLAGSYRCVLSCHDWLINWITGFAG